jgi:hypothetical protein
MTAPYDKDWESKLAQGDIDDLWQRFANELSITYEENIPESRSMSRKYDTPWINEESKTALIKKRKLWKKYKYNRNLQNKKKIVCVGNAFHALFQI